MKDIYYHETDEEFDEFWKNAPKWVKSPVRLLRSPAKNKCIDSKKEAGAGGKTARGQCRKELGGNILVRGWKRVAGGVPRGAFLQLVKFNYRGIASRLKRAEFNEPKIYNEAISKFVKLGGSANAFKTAIFAGKDKRPLICGAKCKDKINFSGNVSEDEQIFFDEYPSSEYNNAAGVAIASVVSASVPILVPIINIVKNSKATSEEARLNELEAKNTKEILDQKAKIESDKSEAQAKLIKNLMIGGGVIFGVLITGAIVMKVVKKRRG